MKKLLSVLAALVCCILFSFGQTDYARAGREGIYQIYLGEAKLGEEEKVFQPVLHLGFLRPFSIADVSLSRSHEKSRSFYLGPFLGKETADHMLRLVKKAGFSKAYLEVDEISLTTESGVYLTHTVQIGAYENIDAGHFRELAYQPAHGVFILYEDGLYKFLAGLYASTSKSYCVETAVPYWSNSLNVNPFFRAFR